MERLSVVIITWNSQQDIAPCLDSVLASTGHLSAEITVIDNGSTDNTRAILQSYGKKITVIHLRRNNGVAFARNIGLEASTGDLIWILDVDTTVNRQAVDGMIACLDADPRCGLCSCRLQSETGETQDSCRRMPNLSHKINNILSELTGRTSLLKRFHEAVNRRNEAQFYHREMSAGEPFEAEYVIGACQMFRRSILDTVGYLDDIIFYGPEDADFCLRIRHEGYKIICLPRFHIIHKYNRISRRKIISRMSYLHFKGLIYFYFKHRKRLVVSG
ncbi:MAG: glycosyltransferase family 2 protein [Dysgonamonadaceae bacterium]|jgi:GT2 family glycosyltransferase|nr:glycosyltransferase family 2 protein [Dysgonamonadaceae bacterium]